MNKVLWLEDESEKMDAFFDLAYQENIQLTQVSTFKEFKDEILSNSKFYFDAIILDALGLIENMQEKPSLKALRVTIDFINQHKSQEVIPYFIFSGYLGNDDYNNVCEMLGYENVYYKTKDEKKLLKDIKKSFENNSDTQLKYRYSEVLELCSEDYLGQKNFSRFLILIRHIENMEKLSNTEDMLNPIRKIIERMFSCLAEKGIIPEEIITNKGWINGSSLFLSQKHSDYEYLQEIVPPLIGENIHRLLNIIQDASHGDGELKLKVDQYLKAAQSDYLYRSCVYLLFDLLLWFKDFMSNNQDSATNQSRWKSKLSNGVWIKGTVTRIADNGWGTFQPENTFPTLSIPPKMVNDHGLNENEAIKVITGPSPDGSKTFIKAISREL